MKRWLKDNWVFFCGIASLCAFVYGTFQTKAEANREAEVTKDNISELRSDVKEIRSDTKDIRNFLMNRGRK